jgi:hypothetical protein
VDVPDASIYREFLPHQPRVVETRGVWLGDQPYLSAALARLGGETVEVYRLDAHEPRVYVEHEGEWLGRVYLRNELPADERQELDLERRTMGQEARVRRDRWLQRAAEQAAKMPRTTERDVTPDLLGRLTRSTNASDNRVARAQRAAARLADHGGIEVERPS